MPNPVTELEKSIVRALQQDLPLVSEPYKAVAESIGISEEELIEVQTHLENERFQKLLQKAGFQVLADGDRLKISLPAGKTPQAILELAIDAKIQIRHFMPERLTLETAFLRLLDEADQSSLSA